MAQVARSAARIMQIQFDEEFAARFSILAAAFVVPGRILLAEVGEPRLIR
jgi:hypothetical protein